MLDYIMGGDGLCAIHVKNGNDDSLYYVHKDHLGSIAMITDDKNTLIDERSYDAWGRRRNANNWSYLNVGGLKVTSRGYTGHEHLEQFGIINMNGRMYDPVLGRMLSPDPVLSAATSTQAYNKYSYCGNNPLKYTDPSGYVYKDWKPPIYDYKGRWIMPRPSDSRFQSQYDKYWANILAEDNAAANATNKQMTIQVVTTEGGGSGGGWMDNPFFFDIAMQMSGIRSDIAAANARGSTMSQMHGEGMNVAAGLNIGSSFSQGHAAMGDYAGASNHAYRILSASVTSSPFTINDYKYLDCLEDGSSSNANSPSITSKYTTTRVGKGGIEVEGYSTNTVSEGNLPVEVVLDGKTGLNEAVIYKTSIGQYGVGVDGSHTYGTSFISTGTTSDGRGIIDISIPYPNGGGVGTTIYFNPNTFRNMMQYSAPIPWWLLLVPVP